MKASQSWIVPFLLGAGTMYVIDPDSGRRRRAAARDRGIHLWHRSSEYLDRAVRDLRNRARGRIADLRQHPEDRAPDDRVLTERVRAKLGRYVSHPHAIEVDAAQGHVILTGPILRWEERPLLRAIRHVRGVRDVESRLDEHDSPENVPALQGGIPRRGEVPELAQTRWSPGTQLLAVTAALAVAGLATRALTAPHRQADTPSL